MTRFSWKRSRPEAQNVSVHMPAVVPLLHELRPLYESEVRRARRYERPLSVMVLGLDSIATDARNDQQCILLGQLLHDVLRETDLLSYIPSTKEFVALLPEADGMAADDAGERLRRLWCLQTSVLNLNVGTAAYPAAGLLLDDLIDAARRALREPRVSNQHAGRAQDFAHG